MPTGKHHFVEQTPGWPLCGARQGPWRASGLRDTQEGAHAYGKELNPEDHADVEHVRSTQGGVPDKRRPLKAKRRTSVQ